MSDVNAIIADLPPYRKQMVLVTKNQDTRDIIDQILTKHEKTKPEYDAIALRFWKGDPLSTAKHLFDVLKRNVKYSVEGLDNQSVKTPGSILVQGKGDCKHYASFIMGVFDALKRKGYNIDAVYRFAGYNNSKRPKHVFAVLRYNGREYFIDPVLSYFDKRSPMYNYKEDYVPGRRQSIGELYDISGVPGMSYGHWTDIYGPTQQDLIGLSFNKDKFKKQVKSVVKAPVKVVKTVAKTAGNAGKAVVHVAKQAYGVVPRNSYLGMMHLDAFRFAKNIWQKAARDRNSANWKKIADFWKKLGGNPDSLWKAVEAGKNLYNRRHPRNKIAGVTSDYYDMYDDEGYSNHPTIISGDYYFEESDPALNAALGWIAGVYDMDAYTIGDPTLAAILASAAPIIAAMASLLAAMNIHKEGPADGSDPGEIYSDPIYSAMPLPGQQSMFDQTGSGNYLDTVRSAGSGLFSQAPYQPAPVPDTYSNQVDNVSPDEDRDKTKNWFAPIEEWYEENKTAVKWGVGLAVGIPVTLAIIRELKGPKRRR